MIVTVTPNPSIDRAVMIDVLRRGEVHRSTANRVDPGGKGVNVSRALAAQGAESVAVVPIGGPEGHLLEELLDTDGVTRRSVPVLGAVRMNISILEPDGTTTKLNEPGPTLDENEVAALLDATLDLAAGAEWIVGCGSLPPGVPADFYASLVVAARDSGARVAIDSSGPSMAAAIGARPHLIKPNAEELAELVGADLTTLQDVRDAAMTLVDAGIGIVAVSLGQDGALLVSREDTVHAHATASTPVSTVGAGDCMLAGLLHSLTTGLSASAALAVAVRWGTAAVALPGSGVPTPEDLRDIDVTVDTSPSLTYRLGH
ncbi:1-phosphofructokinase [Demequina muriae]|uniref:1-phosphofructokinase n=1 Tax=Demequina muriae TaxID=3051664 RepID=A0ABT8GF12_9MICO|nr:1-phosphofructokinase [Demequina sp. EGI L300058]MDN4479934.1 1-phosphofructokinase [Demequina sp. EGI L300058]